MLLIAISKCHVHWCQRQFWTE